MSDTSPILIDTPVVPELLARVSPAASSVLESAGLVPDAVTMVELSANSELYELVADHIAQSAESITSYSLNIGRKLTRDCCGDEEDGASQRTVSPGLGLGLHRFVIGERSIYALLQTLGEPVGTDCGATLLKTMVLISPRAGDIESLRSFCEQLVQSADKVHPTKFTVFRWHIQYSRWMRGQVTSARPIESVVLPKATQDTLIGDLDDFLSRDTKSFYDEHGIPHKRSYLFHGTPGAGKTSAIQAIAGRYGRNVCYLSANPEMTDDSLKSAIEHVPHKSIVVLEDVDALFDGQRAKKDGKAALTFSGLLNALDGVGGSSGQIFVLTTNHRERLDPALIRNGRVDLHIEFKDATTEQIEGLFAQFYKSSSAELAADFARALQAKLGERSVSMAALQSFFITMRRKSAEEAIGSVGRIVTELEERAASKAIKEAEDKARKESTEEASDNKEAAETDEDKPKGKVAKKSTAAEAETHVHIHVHKP